MAKRSNRSRRSSRRSPIGRYNKSNPVRRASLPRTTSVRFTSPLLHQPNYSRPSMSIIEDGRRWKPPFTSTMPRTVYGSAATPSSRPSTTTMRMHFQLPKNAVICARRTIRREVLHAAGVAGRRGPRRRPRFNENSRYSC